ncbi:MAG: winged helix-turn-helix domain-containing protein [Rhodocyclaceae bacterium]|nr:winged helix-turn-helix domain-containing protein [Rhodocyclaceae bacterium]MDZ4213194.1 winged helix-turn-helix domain-containing protein [Rhodocyclaceae bacterium]
MSKLANRQPVLKPQDLLVLLALLSRGEGGVTYPELAERTGLAVSAVHASLKRAAAARLLLFQERRPMLLRPQLKEFLLTGAKYAFPPLFGSLSRGLPTGYAAPPLNTIIAPSSDPVPVWPSAKGAVRGLSLVPLYPTVPEAALRDEKLYAMLSLFDAIRAGQARERNAAQELLTAYFA